jgi:hypothetical protein
MNMLEVKNPKFPLGRILITASACELLKKEEIKKAINRHAVGDWEPTDKEVNEIRLKKGWQITSEYLSSDNIRFLVITSADRKTTTVMIVDEYPTMA